MIAFNWKGAGRLIEPNDITAAAGFLNTDEASIRAVMKIEAAGKGFDAAGRPTMLFEPHIFHRELGKVNPTMVRDAERAKVAAMKWGAIPYPKSANERYKQLEAASQFDVNAALRSASWGLGQVMGFNHVRAGYDIVDSMVEAMKESEGKQLLAMAHFIKSSHLDDELREHDWAAFARGYNGAGYAKNKYDTKLASAYASFSTGTMTA